MKKKIIILVSLFLFMASIVNASSINGDYSGYSIVKIKVDNNDTNPVVPAINFNGTTMVPVRFVSESMGSTVSWRADTQTVYISTNKSSIKFMKIHHAISNAYEDTIELGMSLQTIFKDMTLAYSLKNPSKQVALTYLLYVAESLKDLESKKVSLQNTEDDLLSMTQGSVIDITSYKQTIRTYESTINYYITALEDLVKYMDNFDQVYFDSFSSNAKQGFNQLQNSIDLAILEKKKSDDYIFSIK